MSTHHLSTSRVGARLCSKRPGSVSAYFLLALPVLLLVMGLVIHSAMLMLGRLEMQNAADAAALAAARMLADDDILLAGRSDGFPESGSQKAMLPILEKARKEAQRLVGVGVVLGQTLKVDPNSNNDREGEIVFASLETPRDQRLVVANVRDRSYSYLHLVNTVRIRLEATEERGQPLDVFGGPLSAWSSADVIRVATATLDRDVIGFRPILGKSLELVPIALLADPARSVPESWHYQVESSKGEDRWRFDRETGQASQDEADGLREMTVVLLSSSGGGEDKGNACLLQMGPASMDTLTRQIREGVSKEDLADLGGEFLLGNDNTLKVPGSPVGPGSDSAELDQLRASLETLQKLGEPRVWPLYSGFDSGVGRAELMGFVAARVLSVGLTREGSLTIVLQPAALVTAHAVTDSTRRVVNNITIYSPYICKVRLVE